MAFSTKDRARLLRLSDVLADWHALQIVASKFGALQPDEAGEATRLETEKEQLTAELRKTDVWPAVRDLIEASDGLAAATRRLFDIDVSKSNASEMRALLASALRVEVRNLLS